MSKTTSVPPSGGDPNAPSPPGGSTQTGFEMITDPEILNFVNEWVRPLAERLIATSARGQDFAGKYQTLAASFPNDATVIDDGRDETTNLTGADVHKFAGDVIALLQEIDARGTAAEAHKAAVRPLEQIFSA